MYLEYHIAGHVAAVRPVTFLPARLCAICSYWDRKPETGTDIGYKSAGSKRPEDGLFTVRPDTAPIASGKPLPPFDPACTRTATAFALQAAIIVSAPPAPAGERARRTTQPARGPAPCAPRQALRRPTPHSRGISRLIFRDITRPPGLTTIMRGGPSTGAPAIHPSRDRGRMNSNATLCKITEPFTIGDDRYDLSELRRIHEGMDARDVDLRIASQNR